jgi:membrane protease YdiL (CAAX protease family)
VRWGIPDAVWVWAGSLFVAAVVGSIVAAARGRDAGATDAIDLVVGLAAQDGFVIVAIGWIARAKGLGTLGADFGLALHLRDAPWLAVGVLLQVGASGLVALLEAVGGGLDEQEAARQLSRSDGPEVVLLVLGVVLVAPLAEELLFRGLLLRALLRRMTAPMAVVVSAGVFAVVHLLDPSAAPFLVPLAIVGLVAGMLAVRSGELSQPIMLHAGFNLLSAVLLVAG